MGASWTDFYKGRLLSESYRAYAFNRYKPFLGAINRRTLTGDRVVEVGCGLGTMTSLLREFNKLCDYRCYDICPEMVALAKINLRRCCPVDVGDARLMTGVSPDVVHSHGLLEHMSDDDIRGVISASQSDGARLAIHYVPGNKYVAPSYGDERLMSLDDWKRIAAPTSAFKFNDDYDYCLIWDWIP